MSRATVIVTIDADQLIGRVGSGRTGDGTTSASGSTAG